MRIELPTAFDRYTATRVIGQGGAGRVLFATDRASGTHAIKVLDTSEVPVEKIKRFKNEIYFCMKNTHPNIITVTDYGLLTDGPKISLFYVMPFYPYTLRDLIKRRIQADECLKYFALLLDGIEAAHLQRVVHRDLKPENILLDTQTDRLVVGDFGIALFEEEELFTAVETKDTTRLANFQYSAPEQRARGQAVDGRADIFALGMILNEMFTGEIPHGTGYKTIAAVSTVHGYLDPIVEKMLSQSPADRPRTVDEIKQQLIAHKNLFVTQQRLDTLKGAVLPLREVDDPIVRDPIRLVNHDYRARTLTLTLNQAVNTGWKEQLPRVGGSWPMGCSPTDFDYKGNTASVTVRPDGVQEVINSVKEWLPKANELYKNSVEHAAKEADIARRKQLEQQAAEEEIRLKVLRETKI